MLPNFKKAKKKIHKFYLEYMEMVSYQVSYPVKEVPRLQIHEGDKIFTVDINGLVKECKIEEFKVEYTTKADEIRNNSFFDNLKAYKDVASEMAKKQFFSFFDTISKEVEKVGNVTNMKGKKITPDDFFDMLAKIQIDFDENEKAILPTIVTGPESADSFKEMFDEIEKNKIYRDKFNNIIEIKLMEYRAREGNRKLVE